MTLEDTGTYAIGPTDARRILTAMGEQGQPPPRGALHVNVGTDPLLEAIRRVHLEPLREEPLLSTFKLVVGPYGGGKTQFLMALREHGWALGFAVAYVDLAPDKGAFHQIEAIYRRVAGSIALPPGGPMLEPDRRGLPGLLEQWVDARREQVDPRELAQWVKEEVARAAVPSLSYGHAVAHLILAILEERWKDRELLSSWLLGEEMDREDRRELRAFGVREHLDRSTAARWLYSLARLLHVLEVPGFMLLFDEVERVMSLRRSQRATVAENLRTLIDDTARGELHGSFVVYAVQPEFFEQFVGGYPALAQRLDRRFRATPRVPEATIVDLDELPVGTVELLSGIGERMLHLARIAWGEDSLDPSLQRRNIDRLARAFAGSVAEATERRPFVKAVYQMLLRQRQDPRPLDDEDIAGLVDFVGTSEDRGGSGDGPGEPRLDGEFDIGPDDTDDGGLAPSTSWLDD